MCDIIELIRGLSIGKTYNGEFKSDVALAALSGELTVAEVSRMYNVPESIVRRWRREGLEHIMDGFNAKNSSNKTGSCDSEEKIAMLERKVGQLTLDNDFLKKILGVSEKERFMMVERNGKIAVRRQCMLLNLNRSKIYYCNKKPNKEELQLTVSMDGKGRWADNVYIERFLRTIKYETALLKRFKHINDVKKHIQQFVYFYNLRLSISSIERPEILET